MEVYGKTTLWDEAEVAANDLSGWVYVDLGDTLGVYLKVSPAVDIDLQAYIAGKTITVYEWRGLGTDWVFDMFPIPMASAVRLKVLGETTITAILNVKR